MIHNPFFSVIIPTFNRAYTLERAIQSVLDQSFGSYELIIIDDGSTDETSEVLKQFSVSFIHLKTNNGGVSKARNLGVAHANGMWLAFLDSDDEWMKDKLQKQFDFIQNNPLIKLVHGEEIWIRNGVRVNPKNIHKKEGGDIFARSTELCLISPSAAVIEKEVFHQLGGFREDFPVCEDYDLWLKFTSLYKVGFIEDPIIYKYGGHDDQLSTSMKAMDYYRVLSMLWIIQNRKLSNNHQQVLLKTVIKKCEILIKGYKKHNNIDRYEEMIRCLKFVEAYENTSSFDH